MGRKKVKLQWIMDDAARKAAYRKRVKSVLKLAKEISVLCGVDACTVVYSPYDEQPLIWPSSPSEAARVLQEFKSRPENDRFTKRLTQEDFLRQSVEKSNAQLAKQQRKNRKMEMENLINQLMMPGVEDGLRGLTIDKYRDLDWTIDNKLKEVRRRMESIQGPPAVPQPSAASPAAVSIGQLSSFGAAAPAGDFMGQPSSYAAAPTRAFMGQAAPTGAFMGQPSSYAAAPTGVFMGQPSSSAAAPTRAFMGQPSSCSYAAAPIEAIMGQSSSSAAAPTRAFMAQPSSCSYAAPIEAFMGQSSSSAATPTGAFMGQPSSSPAIQIGAFMGSSAAAPTGAFMGQSSSSAAVPARVFMGGHQSTFAAAPTRVFMGQPSSSVASPTTVFMGQPSSSTTGQTTVFMGQPSSSTTGQTTVFMDQPSSSAAAPAVDSVTEMNALEMALQSLERQMQMNKNMPPQPRDIASSTSSDPGGQDFTFPGLDYPYDEEPNFWGSPFF